MHEPDKEPLSAGSREAGASTTAVSGGLPDRKGGYLPSLGIPEQNTPPVRPKARSIRHDWKGTDVKGRRRAAVAEVMLALVLAGCATAAGVEWQGSSTTTTTTVPAAEEAVATPDGTIPEEQDVAEEEPVAPDPSPAQTDLSRGDSGEAVRVLQERLRTLHYDPGVVDGVFGQATEYALYAFQKVQGLEPTGVATAEVRNALASPVLPEALVPNGGAQRVEADLGRQLLFVYRDGRLALISHISSGSGRVFCEGGPCRRAVTPTGTFQFLWRVDGWDVGALGGLYNPVYFTSDGIAVHGALSVPLYPDSHGCLRIPMHTAERFPSLVANGDPVYVLE